MSAAETEKSGTFKGLKLTNTLTRQKEDFRAIDDGNVRLYVCGPTVYDFAHIGNARPVIVFDVLFRLLRHLYGADHVTYARNITDVDDKINARALRDFPDLSLNEAIARVTQKTADQFHKDIRSLGVLEPSIEPRATQHISGMVEMIAALIEKGHAYQAGGEVLFDTLEACQRGSWTSSWPGLALRLMLTRRTPEISCSGNCLLKKSPAGTARGAGGVRAGTSSALS